MRQRGRRSIAWTVGGAVVVALLLASAGAFTARAADPIKIGFGMALTGGLSANGKPALLAMQMSLSEQPLLLESRTGYYALQNLNAW